MLLALVVTTNLLGTVPPQVEVQAGQILQVAECEQLVASMNGMPKEPRVNSRGEIILQRDYKCLIMTDVMIEEAAKLMQAGK